MGAIGASLTLSLKRGGLILPLIILPLLAPAVIFGAGAVTAALDGICPTAALGCFWPLFPLAACLLSPFRRRRLRAAKSAGKGGRRLNSSMFRYANPAQFMRLSGALLPCHGHRPRSRCWRWAFIWASLCRPITSRA